ncbi:unnamed protein product [Effrenium voratum]|nr:unnamed protein product [Effrenium voratum]
MKRVFADLTHMPAGSLICFEDANAVEAPTGSSYLIMGYKTCSQQDMQMPGRCRTETPGNGFPGQTAQASDLAWPGGKQPSNLECWPKEWDGAPAPCKEVSVLDDTKNGWPGKCSGLVEIPHVNGTECGENCRQQSTCQSWQNTVYYSCWQGLGKDCFVRSNFVPREAQRLQHGSVRVLKDLTGMQIVGLWKGFDNSEGFFENSADAVLFCKHMCYSDVRCQYWTYAPNFGCWLEDAAQEYSPPYPLTLDAARRDTDYAKDCVAGEYIQHFCADAVQQRLTDNLPKLTDCAERGYRYEPPSMFLSPRTVEPNWESCKSRCEMTLFCEHFVYWPDGGCHTSGSDSRRVVAENFEVISGPINCVTTTISPAESWVQAVTTASPVGMDQPGVAGAGAGVAGAGAVAGVGIGVAGAHAPAETAHMAEIQIPLHGLEVGQLSAPEKHLLEGRYAAAIAQTLDIPITEVKEGPDSNALDSQVRLTPMAGGAALTAWTLNMPLTSSDTSQLAAKLKTPALVENLKVATTQATLPASALPGLNVEVGEPEVGSREHPLKPFKEEPGFWSQWWPLLLAVAIAACIAGFMFMHYQANQSDKYSSVSKKDKRLVMDGRGVSQDSEMMLKDFGTESSQGSYQPSYQQSSMPPPPPPAYSGGYSGSTGMPTPMPYRSQPGYNYA